LSWREEARVGRPAKYPPEFRREAVELVKTAGRSQADVARSLGINVQTLSGWVIADRDAQARAADPTALSDDERDELKRLRKENASLREDREILRKAAAYFARETMR
jgi:transposase